MQSVNYCGETAVMLHNAALRVIVFPERGGKTASIQRAGFELLAQPRNGIYPPLTPDMPFHLGDASGFDDVFPSMGVEKLDWKGRQVTLPDHGMLWSRPMDCREETNGLSLRYMDGTLPFLYEKHISLEDDTVRWEYAITNCGDTALPCVWVCHCLMRLEPECRFGFPADGTQVENLIAGSALGDAGARTRLQGDGYNFSRPPRDNSMLKFYLDQPVRNSACNVIYPVQNIRAQINWDSKMLPYLGFWITTGAYRGDQNFAFEPATAYYDTVACAKARGRLPMLAPGASRHFWISISINWSR